MSDRQPQLHLASASPRRAEILDSLGLAYTAAGVDIDERRRANEAADAMVVRLASEKAAAARTKRRDVVLAADTVVVVDAEVLGKPGHRDEALAMLARLSGRRHQVMTGVALCWGSNERTALSITEVIFRDIGPDEALAYWQSGEPGDKAGAYAIQGLGAVFIAGISGSHSGVVGLPVFETVALLAAAGIEVLRVKPDHE